MKYQIDSITAKKALASEGLFASVEDHFEETLSTRSKPMLTQLITNVKLLWSRRWDLHPHHLVDKKGIPLHELRRQTATRANSFYPKIATIDPTKKTDGRLRECLSTLVGIQPRSKNEYYHHRTKKSRKEKYNQNAK